MKNCTCKEQLLIRPTCDEPIIKLFVDDCSGCPIYPTTSTDAVLTSCEGKTLEQELADIIESILLINNDLTTKVLDENTITSLKYKVNNLESLTNDLPEIRTALSTLLQEIERLECIADALDDLDLSTLANSFTDYINRLKTNENLLNLILISIGDPFENITYNGGITLGELENAIRDLSAQISNIYVKYTDISGLIPGDDTTVTIPTYNSRKPYENNFYGSGNYAVFTKFDHFIDDVKATGKRGGWMTLELFKLLLSNNLIKLVGTTNGIITITDSATKTQALDYVNTLLIDFETESIDDEVVRTNIKPTSLFKHTAGGVSIYVIDNGIRRYKERDWILKYNQFIIHFYLPDNEDKACVSSSLTSYVQLPCDYDLMYDNSLKKLGQVTDNIFRPFDDELRYSFEDLARPTDPNENVIIDTPISAPPSDNSTPVFGDLNNDRKVDVADVDLMIDCVLGKTNPAIDINATIDLNDDGLVDVSDVDIEIDIVLGKYKKLSYVRLIVRNTDHSKVKFNIDRDLKEYLEIINDDDEPGSTLKDRILETTLEFSHNINLIFDYDSLISSGIAGAVTIPNHADRIKLVIVDPNLPIKLYLKSDAPDFTITSIIDLTYVDRSTRDHYVYRLTNAQSNPGISKYANRFRGTALSFDDFVTNPSDAYTHGGTINQNS